MLPSFDAIPFFTNLDQRRKETLCHEHRRKQAKSTIYTFEICIGVDRAPRADLSADLLWRHTHLWFPKFSTLPVEFVSQYLFRYEPLATDIRRMGMDLSTCGRLVSLRVRRKHFKPQLSETIVYVARFERCTLVYRESGEKRQLVCRTKQSAKEPWWIDVEWTSGTSLSYVMSRQLSNTLLYLTHEPDYGKHLVVTHSLHASEMPYWTIIRRDTSTIASVCDALYGQPLGFRDCLQTALGECLMCGHAPLVWVGASLEPVRVDAQHFDPDAFFADDNNNTAAIPCRLLSPQELEQHPGCILNEADVRSELGNEEYEAWHSEKSESNAFSIDQMHSFHCACTHKVGLVTTSEARNDYKWFYTDDHGWQVKPSTDSDRSSSNRWTLRCNDDILKLIFEYVGIAQYWGEYRWSLNHPKWSRSIDVSTTWDLTMDRAISKSVEYPSGRVERWETNALGEHEYVETGPDRDIQKRLFSMYGNCIGKPVQVSSSASSSTKENRTPSIPVGRGSRTQPPFTPPLKMQMLIGPTIAALPKPSIGPDEIWWKAAKVVEYTRATPVATAQLIAQILFDQKSTTEHSVTLRASNSTTLLAQNSVPNSTSLMTSNSAALQKSMTSNTVPPLVPPIANMQTGPTWAALPLSSPTCTYPNWATLRDATTSRVLWSDVCRLQHPNILALILDCIGPRMPHLCTVPPYETDGWCIIKARVPKHARRTDASSADSYKRRADEMIPVEFQWPVRDRQIVYDGIITAITGVASNRAVYHMNVQTFPDRFDPSGAQCSHGLHGYSQAHREQVFNWIPEQHIVRS